MKRMAVIFMAFMLLLSFGSCAKKTQPDLQDDIEQGEVTTEPFESMDINYIESNYYLYPSLDELVDDADLIVIASTNATFTDAKATINNQFNEQAQNENDISLAHSYTARDYKVHKVIKGAKDIKNVRVAESAVMIGNGILATEGEYIAKKNVKYILFLKQAVNTPGIYYAALKQGKFCTDGKDSSSIKQVDNKMLNEIKKEYKNEFKEG